MGAPETPEELERVRVEVLRLKTYWDELGRQVNKMIDENRQPVHPPASFSAVLVDLTMAGWIPTFPMTGSPEDQKERDLRIAVGMFRWGQMCAKYGLTYEDLLQCTCADVRPGELDSDLRNLLENPDN